MSTIIRKINTTIERFKANILVICGYFSFYEQLKFLLSCVEHETIFITSGPELHVQMYISCFLQCWSLVKVLDMFTCTILVATFIR